MYGQLAKLINNKLRSLRNNLSHIPEDKSTWPKEWTEVVFKEYSRLEEIKLPKPNLEEVNFVEVLEKRSSTRQFSKKPMSIQDVSNILYVSAGLRNKPESELTHRPYPSGGARYPLEIYLHTLNVSGLKEKIYHYNVKKHSLELISLPEDADDLKKEIGTGLLKWTKKAGLTLLISAVWDRNFLKYSDYGYRMILFEVGHLMQNLQLTSEACGLSYCSYVGLNEEKIDNILDIGDVKNENVLYAISIGNKL